MGKNQQRRRAEKQRRRDQRVRGRTSEPRTGRPSAEGARSAFDPFGDPEPPFATDSRSRHGAQAVDVRGILVAAAMAPKGTYLPRITEDLAQAELRSGGRTGREATAVLLEFVGMLYENGWQPADLMHAARKKVAATGQWLAGVLIDAQARSADTGRRMPDEWAGQLQDIRDAQALPDPGAADSAVRWLADAGLGLLDAWQEVVQVSTLLMTLPGLERLVPPPSCWPRAGQAGPGAGTPGRDQDRRGIGSPGAASSRAEHDPKMLAKIRALLAKAESTEFPDEAEALTAKAQSLMSRYSIDEAVLGDGSGGRPDIHARRVHIDSPYASTKVQLLAAVGAANRVRVIWLDSVDIATVVGFPIDLDLVEMLYTSLLVQATRAMTETGRQGAAARSVSFRKAFLLSYAHRIGERLERASADVTAAATSGRVGAELVLARRAREVDEEFERLFPSTTKMRTRRVNAHGWHAGREAADRATLSRGRLDDRAAR